MQHSQHASGGQLEYRSRSARATGRSRPIEIAVSILNQPGIRAPAIRSSCELMKKRYMSQLIHLENHSKTASSAAECRSVEIAGAVADERAIRIDSVSSVETVQHRFHSGSVDFENSPEVADASPAGRTVQVAGGIAEQACLGNAAVWSTSELVQGGFLAGGVQFEDSSGIGAEAAPSGCAVNVSCRIQDHGGNGQAAIPAAIKGIEDAEGLRRGCLTGEGEPQAQA